MSADDRTRVMAPPEIVAVGTQLSGTYELDQRLASGGMGEVFRGHNIQTGDPVAIKIVLPEFARDAMILSLFRKEASILNHLYHEAIVRYHVFAIDQAIGRPYLAMEFVDGASLVEMFEHGPLPPDQARVLLARLASGLNAAHEAGVVHRDLSPDNIILPGGKVARAKIIDFGIARSASVGGGTLLGGTFAGKYNYVSPEQLGLFGGEITAQSDIYSLGLVIAAALLGRPVEMSGSQVEIIEKRRVVPDLSAIDEGLRPVIDAMLQPDPANRPSNMAEIADWVRPAPAERTTRDMPGALPPRPVSRQPETPTVAPAPPSPAPAGPTVVKEVQPVTESPFGPYPGPSAVPVAGPKLADPVPERTEPRRGSAWLWIVLLAAGVGSAAAGAWFAGLLDPYMRPVPETVSQYAAWPSREPRPDGWSRAPAPVKPVEPVEPDPVPVPPPETGAGAVDDVADRVDWVRSFVGGPCFFATTTSASTQGVDVEGIGENVDAFRNLLTGFMQAFGTEPQITAGLIRHTQCPVTDFLNALRDKPSVAPGLSLEKYELANRDPMAGEVELLPTGQTYLFLVDHDGIVHNLETFLRREGGKAVFRIPLGLATSNADKAAGVPQVLVALGSQLPIEAFRDGKSTVSADLLPRMLEEIRRKDGAAAATAKFFRVRS